MQQKIETFDAETGEVLLPSPARLQRRVRNWLNYQEELIIHEVNTLPSLTIPDKAYTVGEILEKFSRGISLGNMSTPVYNLDDEGNELIPVDWQRLDISEKHERLAQAKAYTEQLRKNMADEQEKEKERLRSAPRGQEAVSTSTPEVDTTPDVSLKLD